MDIYLRISEYQNRRQNFFNRGALCFCGGGLTL